MRVVLGTKVGSPYVKGSLKGSLERFHKDYSNKVMGYIIPKLQQAL